MAYYNNSLTNTLNKLYPEILFNFNNWETKQKQREFLDNFAKNQKFDPLVAKNWYFVSNEDVILAVC